MILGFVLVFWLGYLIGGVDEQSGYAAPITVVAGLFTGITFIYYVLKGVGVV